MITRRIGTDSDGWPIYGDITGRSLDEVIAAEQSLLAYWEREISGPAIRVQLGVDADGFPVVAR